ncbi:MAG TPA: ATP-binding protein [Chloroflexota bacterium]|nr:ATP-binding protein [Chloroflexota bacterium]
MNEAVPAAGPSARPPAAPRARCAAATGRPRGQLVRKYVVIFVVLVSGALLTSGLIELYFSYLENQSALVALQREQAATAAVTIEQFVREIQRAVDATIPPAWAADVVSPEQRLDDFRRLSRQAPAITEIDYLDATGHEVVRYSRITMNLPTQAVDHSAEPRFAEARGGRTYFSPVYFRNQSEPYMTIAIGDPGAGGGVTAAEVSLKLLWEVVTQIRIGHAGYAYVVDASGRLIAHPDISLVLQPTDLSGLSQVQAALPPPVPGEPPPDPVTIARGPRGRMVLTAYRRIDPPGWTVFVEQPLDEAFQPLFWSAARTATLLLIGLGLAVLASFVLARRMVRPIQALQDGAARIGGGALDQRIEVHTGDELETLAEEFNRMTERLRDSYTNLEQKVAERTRELAEALAQLEVANQHKSDLLSTVSHELRTPLAAIKGYATALLRFGPRIRPAERREFLEAIDRAADQLSALIEDLLLAQRLEAGRLPITPEPLSLAELAEEVVAELAPRAVDHAFVCRLPPDLPLARGDSRRVRQVLLNLLDNAVKYSPGGGEIHLAADARNGDVLVSVRDEGLGIPAEHLARVFERFHRLDTNVTRTTRGTGLGLAICQGIVEAQGGRIWAESPGVGQGTTFWFTIPCWEDT